jgi:hypothetical protein
LAIGICLKNTASIINHQSSIINRPMAGESKQVMKNITRVKDPKKRVNGYYVRICWKGQKCSKLFSLKQYDTEEEALQEAIAWRNETELAIGKPRTERNVMGITRPTNTGVKGIRKVMVQDRKRGKPVGRIKPKLIITTLDDKGKQCRTSVSIERHGKDKALELARQIHKIRNYC